MVIGLTGVITPHLINDFRFSYLRNAWEWSARAHRRSFRAWAAQSKSAPIARQRSVPYPVDRGNALSRFWDGQDKVFRDDLNLVSGNHLFQFGGTLPAQFR